MKTSLVVLLALLASAHSPVAAAMDTHLRQPFREKSAGLVPGTYKQSIDHFGALAGQTFDQRYWVNSDYASASDSAPVILHICGEGNAEEGYFLNDNAIEWAQTLGAHIVYLEHRYYGLSQPFADLSSEHMEYLTLGNVLEDLASFQNWISTSNGWKGKWISVGGSYSGTLSAIYRYKHPELVVGALASSAPMMISSQVTPGGDEGDVAGLSSTDLDDSGSRQWAYQSCTTFGFWVAFGSEIESPSSWLCQQLFGNAPFVNSAAYNQDYYSPFISSQPAAPSNILFSYGSEDVWTQIGLSSSQNKNPNIAINVIEGAGHHFDLNPPDGSDSSQVVNARQVFVTLAQKWLSQ